MEPTYTATSYRIRVLLPIIASVCVAVGLLCRSALQRDPGDLIVGCETLAIYSTLGYFIWYGHQWARWVLFGFMVLTALATLFFVTVDHTSSASGILVLIGIGVVYVSFAVMIAVPTRRLAS